MKILERFRLLGPVILLTVLTLACSKERQLDIEMTQVNYGNLKIRLTDDQGNGLPDIRVNIGQIADEVTDANGWVTFSDLLIGNYGVTVEEATVNGAAYNVYKNVQVVTSVTKEYEIDVTEYSGDLFIQVLRDNWPEDYLPVQGVRVGLFPAEEYTNGMSFDRILDIVTHEQTTDAEGWVVFEELPLQVYGAIAYFSESDYQVDGYFCNLNDKGEVLRLTWYYY